MPSILKYDKEDKPEVLNVLLVSLQKKSEIFFLVFECSAWHGSPSRKRKPFSLNAGKQWKWTHLGEVVSRERKKKERNTHTPGMAKASTLQFIKTVSCMQVCSLTAASHTLGVCVYALGRRSTVKLPRCWCDLRWNPSDEMILQWNCRCNAMIYNEIATTLLWFYNETATALEWSTMNSANPMKPLLPGMILQRYPRITYDEIAATLGWSAMK